MTDWQDISTIQKPVLLPCPFCGGKADAHTWEDPMADDGVVYAGAYCLECDAHMTKEVLAYQSSATVLAARILAWNRRAPLPAPPTQKGAA